MNRLQVIIYTLVCVLCALFGFYVGGVLYNVLG